MNPDLDLDDFLRAAAHPAEGAPVTPTALGFAGVDLSLTATGVALSDGSAYTVASVGTRADSLADRRWRMLSIVAEVLDLVPCGPEWAVAVEAPAYASRSGHAHDRSGLWWLTVDALIARGNLVVEIAPTKRAKYATGKGNAGKDEVLLAVVRRFPLWTVSNNNEADSAVLCAMVARANGRPLDDVPAAQAAVAACLV